MRGATHLKLGVAAGISLGVFGYKTGIEFPNMIATSILCAVGGILPDIDTKHSIASGELKVTGFIVRHTVGHRGVFHTPICGAVISVLCGIGLMLTPISPIASIGLFIGYLLHLLQDTFTKRGIMWGFPISRHYYAIYKVRSGKSDLIETLITLAILIAFVTILYGAYILWCT